jgi:hypothetical protein
VQGSLIASVTVMPTTSAVASTKFPGMSPNCLPQIRIANTTTAWAYVNFGNLDIAAVTAATVAASLPVAPGSVAVVSVAGDVNGASVILDAASTGGTTVIFTRGEGL